MGFGEIIGAGVGMASSYIQSQRQEEQNAEMIRQQEASAKHMTGWNNNLMMKNWRDTNFKAQVEEARKAGLSIGMLYGKGGTQQPITHIEKGGEKGGAQPISSGILEGIGMMLQNQNMEAQRELIKAQTEKVKSETTGQNLDNTWEEFLQGKDLNEGADGTPLKERSYRVDMNEKEARILNHQKNREKLDADMQKIGVDMRKGEAEIERIKTDTDIQKQLKEYRESMNPMEIERYQKELELLKDDPKTNTIVRWISTILGFGGDVIGLKK